MECYWRANQRMSCYWCSDPGSTTSYLFDLVDSTSLCLIWKISDLMTFSLSWSLNGKLWATLHMQMFGHLLPSWGCCLKGRETCRGWSLIGIKRSLGDGGAWGLIAKHYFPWPLLADSCPSVTSCFMFLLTYPPCHAHDIHDIWHSFYTVRPNKPFLP